MHRVSPSCSSSYARLCRTKIRKSRRYRYLKNAGHPSGGPAGRDIAFETRRNLSQGHKGVGETGGWGILKTRNADHERTGRTNVTSRATSSPTIRPSCTTGCLQTRQGGAVASDMKSPKQPRHSAECPLPSQAPCTSAQRQCVKSRKTDKDRQKEKTNLPPKAHVAQRRQAHCTRAPPRPLALKQELGWHRLVAAAAAGQLKA